VTAAINKNWAAKLAKKTSPSRVCRTHLIQTKGPESSACVQIPWMRSPALIASQTSAPMGTLHDILDRIRACQTCQGHLPYPPRPVLRADSPAKVLIVGQAPGRKVHDTGIPWNDASGVRLRQWLNLTSEQFYDTRTIAIIPMGFCYPGIAPSGRGDLPPRPECAPLWHASLLAALPQIRLTFLVGAYAQSYYLKLSGRTSLAQTVRRAPEFLPRFFPLPHPSPRNLRWFKHHPWFEAEIVPHARLCLENVLALSR
jgi:uracil-DNA glycosylase